MLMLLAGCHIMMDQFHIIDQGSNYKKTSYDNLMV